MDALDTYDAARLPVPAPVSRVVGGGPNQRQRFYVELVQGETTIVSWKELVQEANNEAVSVDSSGKALVQETNSQVVSREFFDKALVQEVSPDSFDEAFDLDQVEEHIQVEKSRIEESGSVVKRDKVQHQTGKKESSKSSKVQGKRMRKEILDSVTCAAHQKLQEKKSTEHYLQSSSSMSTKVSCNIKRRNNKGRNKLPDLNLPYRDYALVLMESPKESSCSADSSDTSSLLASWTKALSEESRDTTSLLASWTKALSEESTDTTSLLASWTNSFHEIIVDSPRANST